MKFVLFGLVLIGQSAIAGECPIFAQIFTCNGGHADVVMGEADGVQTFRFRGVPDSSPFVLADGILHKVDYGLSKGEYQAHCEAGRLFIHSSLISPTGEQLETEDEVYVERKALVRVRVTKIPAGVPPAVTACKPYIAPVH